MTDKHRPSRGLSRRAFVGGSAAAAALGSGPWIGRARGQENRFAGEEIRILTWTDVTGQAAVRNIMQTFEAATGARVIPDLTGATSEMVARIKASAARPQFDVAILSGVGAVELANDGLLAMPDASMLPNLERVLPQYRSGAGGFGVGYFLWNDGLMFSTDALSNPPTSYRELWNPEHAGRIYLPSPNTIMAMELTVIAAEMAGGDIHNPDGGFALLEELRPQALTISSHANQVAELFRAGSLSVGGPDAPLIYSPYIEDSAFSLSGTLDLEEGFFSDLQFMIIPDGHPGDVEVIHAFINHALDPQVQATMAEDVWYGPINQDAPLSEAALSIPYIASPELVASRSIQLDLDYLASVREEWIRLYTEAVTG